MGWLNCRDSTVVFSLGVYSSTEIQEFLWKTWSQRGRSSAKESVCCYTCKALSALKKSQQQGNRWEMSIFPTLPLLSSPLSNIYPCIRCIWDTSFSTMSSHLNAASGMNTRCPSALSLPVSYLLKDSQKKVPLVICFPSCFLLPQDFLSHLSPPHSYASSATSASLKYIALHLDEWQTVLVCMQVSLSLCFSFRR